MCASLGERNAIIFRQYPSLAKAVGLENAQPLDHCLVRIPTAVRRRLGRIRFLANSPWSADSLRERRIEILADWLAETGVETVARESTGGYWIALFQILETRGFEVKLVNADHVKTLPGRKRIEVSINRNKFLWQNEKHCSKNL